MNKIKYRNQKLKDSAQYEPCVCHGRFGTTVWAHSNESKHGKGMGVKAHDLFGAYLCHEAHNDLDTMPELQFKRKYSAMKSDWFRSMWEESMIVACENGYL